MNLHLDAPMIIRTAACGGFIRSNPAFLEKVGFKNTELAKKAFVDWIIPEDRAILLKTLEGKQACCRVNHLTRSGDRLPLEIRCVSKGQEILLLGRQTIDPQPSRLHPQTEKEIDISISSQLDAIAHIIEEQNPGYRCSILLVENGCFVRGAGPSLPEAYNDAIDGFAIGPTIGSCGTAIYWNVPVIVENIQTDPLWAPLADLAKMAGVGACWSHPFTTKDGNVLGAMAFYAPEPRKPTAEQFSRLAIAAKMTGLTVERWRVEQELRKKQKREEELEERLRQIEKMESIGQLAGGVAHDFNNQLGGIMNYADLLLSKTRDPEQISFIEGILRLCKHSGELTHQLLAFSRKGKYQVIPVNLHQTIVEVSAMLERSSDKRIEIRGRLNASPATTLGDPTQLQNAVLNLGLNARDAMPGGGELIFSTENVTRGSDECQDCRFDLTPGDFILLKVTDAGTGMSEEVRKKAFEPFFTTKEQGKGTGMGLASVFGTIVNHKGAIEVDSEVGVGTTISIYLPLSHDTVPDESEETKKHKSGSVTTRILVVDDEVIVRDTTKLLLQSRGYPEVHTCENGAVALEYYKKFWGQTDIVILDMNMPVMNGHDAFLAMRKINPDIKAILATGYSLDENAQQILDEGAAFHLQKPYHINDLITQIENMREGKD